MNIRKRIWKPAGIVVAAIAIAASVSFIALPDREFQIIKSMDIFFNLFREINLFYVDNTDPEELVNKSIEGMLETLDPYTSFIPESAMEDYKAVTEGQYGGVGITIRDMDDVMTVVDVARHHPADKAGIRIGDMLMRVNGEWLTGKTDDEVFEMLKGAPHTKMQLTYLQASTKKEITKELVREMIPIPNVPYYGMLDNERKVGYIRLSNFSSDAGKEVKNALLDLKKTHGIRALVLDIRNNPGGLLVEAVEVVNLFVKRGQEVVSTRGRIKQWDNIYTTRYEPVDTAIALAVVVNRSSASASEIVAGAIQDLDRGVIIGQRTFGKGLVQTTRPLSYNTQVKITTAKYYIPSGRCIQALDYAHREADGSVGHIPDSLIREYRTLKNNRTVRDGGGVSPDVEALPETMSRIAVTLYVRNLIFNYATIYTLQHDTILPARDFKLSDREYDEFIAYLQDKFFDYQTEMEMTFLKLKQLAEKEQFIGDVTAEMDALQAKLNHDRFRDLEIHREDVKELLCEEIVARYYYNAGKIANTMRNDTQIKTAVSVLAEQDRYNELLNN
ncbi:MAG: S41 family peptidase [Bacteroidales bacterium]|jgi:carboxyl-terminal processing protease|nr:S41 family peptidase [Bacteroidales bacterium]